MEIHSVRKIKSLNANHISYAELKRQGWSGSLIKKFLGEPDALVGNPIIKSVQPIKFYLKIRVENIEQNQFFLEEKQKLQQKGFIQQLAAKQKKQKLLAWVDLIDIKIKSFKNDKELFESAIEHYNEMKNFYYMMRGYSGYFAPKWDQCRKYFLYRITVNFLRHRCSSYEKRLEKIQGEVDFNEAYVKLKTKVLKAIAEKYPFLTDECERQIELLKQNTMEFIEQNS